MAIEQVPLRQLEANLVFTFTYGGLLATESTQMRLYNDTGKARVITKVRASVGTTPIGGNVTSTVLKNGVNIFGSGGVTISPGAMTKAETVNNVVWAVDEYLTVSILGVGSTFAGEDLTINVTVSE
jgi:hypothetical protein